MAANPDHITVCICTYKRLELLRHLLTKLQHQGTKNLFTYSIVVVDNDREFSARSIVKDIRGESPIDIDYYVEPKKNIALARNKAVKNAKGHLIAFIDDDEFPVNIWLLNLYKTYNKCKVDGVLGPVKPYFEKEPPQWILKGKMFERPSHKSGLVLHWNNTRTGNVLLRKDIFKESENQFNPEFRHGEDKDFFRRMIEKGYTFVWCDEAPVYERQLPYRFKRAYFLKRALIRGSVSRRHQSSILLPILKTIVAFSIYTLALPFLFFIGHHIFMKYLIKDFDHIGRLIAACGLDIEKYLELS